MSYWDRKNETNQQAHRIKKFKCVTIVELLVSLEMEGMDLSGSEQVESCEAYYTF